MTIGRFLQMLRYLFTGRLDAETEAVVVDSSKQFKAVLSGMETHYVSHREKELLRNRFSTAHCAAIGTWIPRKHKAYKDVRLFIRFYPKIDDIADKANLMFINREKTINDPLFSDMDGISLDDQQRTAIVTGEDYNLVIAGAGSGKTLTIAGKVAYLCKIQGIDPDDILLIAFTRKSAEEMRYRLRSRWGIDIDAYTFHRLGLKIISESEDCRPDVEDDMEGFIKRYLTDYIMDRPEEMKNLIQYFAYYLRIPADLDKFDSIGEAYDYERSTDLDTLHDRYERGRYISDAKKQGIEARRTLKHEQVKSIDEVEIANFLFLNGIRYEYESAYPFATADSSHRAYKPDFFLPEYNIYIEHFGINKDGNLPWLSPIEAEKYKDGIRWKRETHAKNGTCLLETYSYYSSEGRLLQELECMLKAKGVVFKEPDFRDIFLTVYEDAGDKYLSDFISLCSTFISLFKSKAGNVSDLADMLKTDDSGFAGFLSRRSKMFMSIVGPMIDAYDEHLVATGKVDFSDMINKAASLVRDGFRVHGYKWLIIDEYQDISVARYRLIKAILDQTGAKLMCVGDDWQSIYRFAGSDISLFTRFEALFPHPAVMRIEKTYRNTQESIDISGEFVMRNPEQYRKSLRSDRRIDRPLVFIGCSENFTEAVAKTLDKLGSDNGTGGSVLILGRTSYDFDILWNSPFFRKKGFDKLVYTPAPEMQISYMTIHKAKGLEADNVVLLNFRNGTLGFPNKIVDDPILNLVLTDAEEFPYAEERRLMYVALTRSRNRTYVILDENQPSEFFKEFSENPNVEIIHDESAVSGQTVLCPRCRTGHLVIRNGQTEGSSFLGCSNYPICDYTANDVSILQSPKKCPSCGGFLVRRSGYKDFYGCLNYPYCSYKTEIAESDENNNRKGMKNQKES